MATTTRTSYRIEDILTPEARDSLKGLELHARRIVEGMLHGAHRSRRKGVSTEFDHHKQYQPGDPLKHIDWKVSARHDEYFVKRHIEDTALTVRLVVDRSASMLQESGGPSLYLQASRLAASLAYLVLTQRDLVGMVLAAADELLWLPPRSIQQHLVQILQALVTKGAAAEDNLELCLRTMLERAERRGLIVVISDCMFDPVPVQQQLARLQAQGHEVLVLQPRDPNEEDFPFNRWVQFRDRELPSRSFRIDTVPLRKIYREEYQALIKEWDAWAHKYDIHFVSFRSDEHIGTILSEYLAFREEIMGAR
ncbi:MAG: DUF58 domain-containing protein [Lentisphaerae bacterium]|nr:DUF58 domain-containing protein [Lentisphaerota bacterium]